MNWLTFSATGINWPAFFTSFSTMLLVELPDKTLIATLILSTRYRKLPVFIGVSLAFLVQCTLAVAAGSLLRLLSPSLVAYIVAALFAIGAIMLWRSASHEEDDDVKSVDTTSSFKMALVSFTVLLVAELGDASQLLTVALTAKYHAPLEVGFGSWLALVGVAALAILLGKIIQAKVPLHLLQRIAAGVFALFTVLALYTAMHS